MKKILAFIFCILCVNAYADEWEDFMEAGLDMLKASREACIKQYGEPCRPSDSFVQKSKQWQQEAEDRKNKNVIEYSWVEGSTMHRCVIDNNWHTKKCN